jgi:hypothetical protein
MAVKWQRPGVNTPFRIDLEWWQKNNRDIRVYMREILCEDCRASYGNMDTQEQIDWVDELTGEITAVDALWHSLRTCCGLKQGYIAPNTPVIDAVFRTFLANGNKPMTIQELYELLDRRPPETLLRILTTGPIYMGIRPAH